MNQPRYVKTFQRALALAGILFGLATVAVGIRVLGGSDPGYIVFRPLLMYNTAMGMAYVAAGVIAWHSSYRGKYAAATIFVLNTFVLLVIGYLYTTGNAIAIDSLRAMTLRTVVWFALFLGFVWINHRIAPNRTK